jgi:hypothetical protein
MVLHMLRKKVGDVTFKSILNTYLNDPNLAFDYAVTSDFKRVAAQVSGTSLDEFFNDWIYGEGHPQHVVNWSNTSPSSINVQVSQSQSHASVAFFEVDLPLRLIGASGESMDVIASPTSSGASFNFVTGFPVVEVLIDPDVHTLSRNNSAVLGVNDAFAKAELQIYPNPTVDVVTIKSRLLDLMGYSLHDLSGRLIASAKSDHPTTTFERLKVPETSGVYVLTIQTTTGLITRQLVVR